MRRRLSYRLAALTAATLVGGLAVPLAAISAEASPAGGSLARREVRDRVATAAVPAYDEFTGLGDVNLDGTPDLGVVETAPSGGKLWMYPNRGSQYGLGTRALVGSNWNSMRELTGFGDADFNGYPDLLAVEKSTGNLWFYPGRGGVLYAPRQLVGSGGWQGMSMLTNMGPIGGTNGAWTGLAAVETSTGKLWLYRFNGVGFQSRVLIGNSGWSAMSAVFGVGDLNHDGWNDLAAVEAATGKLWLYPGQGSGVLGTRIQIGNGGWTGLRSLEGPGDMDSDGNPDVIGIDKNTNIWWLYPGTAAGTLGTRRQL